MTPVCRFWELWKNPIFLRYCRSRLRPAALGVACMLAVLVAGFVFQFSRTITAHQSDINAADIERTPLLTLLIIQGIILFLLGTAQASGGMTAERDEGVIDYQRLIPMSPASKVIGYLFGLPIREIVMFLCTMPFTLWCFVFGNVPWSVTFSLYGVMASTTVLYYLTGLLTGTVVKNRRWAFLTSIGVIFALYTVIPQAAKFGLVFFKYLTITPMVEDAMPHLLPQSLGSVVDVSRRLFSEARFFNLDFSEAVFTWFSQACLIITFFVMLCRRWRDADAHLCGKFWATGFFLWVQILLLGNALPLIDSGRLFPSQQFSRYALLVTGKNWEPATQEAMGMILAYGMLTLFFLLTISSMITPRYETMVNGWRRAHKNDRKHLPIQADESNSTSYVAAMAIIGGLGWYIFAHMIIESRWFPGHFAPLIVCGWMILVMITCSLLHQLTLEAKGPRVIFLSIVILAVVPLMIAAILFSTSEEMHPVAMWVAGISPLSLPAYTIFNHLSISDMSMLAGRTMPFVWGFWQSIYVIVILRLFKSLIVKRKQVKESATRAISQS